MKFELAILSFIFITFLSLYFIALLLTNENESARLPANNNERIQSMNYHNILIMLMKNFLHP